MNEEKAGEILYMQWQEFLEDNIDYAGVSDAYKMAFKALKQQSVIKSFIDFIDEDEGLCSKCKQHIFSLLHKAGFEWEDNE